jgi:hypothetical protein
VRFDLSPLLARSRQPKKKKKKKKFEVKQHVELVEANGQERASALCDKK